MPPPPVRIPPLTIEQRLEYHEAKLHSETQSLVQWLLRTDELQGEEPGDLIGNVQEVLTLAKHQPAAFLAAFTGILEARLPHFAAKFARCHRCGAELDGRKCFSCDDVCHVIDLELWKERDL